MNSSIKIWAAGIFVIIFSTFAAFYFHWEDVHTYHTAADSLLRGRIDLYAADFGDSRIMDYRYPPFFLFLFAPLALLPYGLTKFIWLWLNIFALYFAAVAVRRTLAIASEKSVRVNLVLLFAFLVSIKYFLMLFQHFNAHLLLVALIFISFYLLLRRNGWIWAAGLTALGITVKIVPVLLLPYFFVKRQWNYLALTAVLTVVFNLLPALYFGADTNFRLFGDWYRHVMVNNEFHDTNGPINLSLKGQLERTLTEIDYSRRVEDKDYSKVNVVSWTKERVEILWLLTAGALGAATLLLIWGAQRKRAKNQSAKWQSSAFDRLAPLEFGLMICLMLIVAPRSNGYYLTAMFFPLAVLIHSIFLRKSKFDLFGLALIITATLLLPLVPGRFEQRYLLVFGVDFYAVLVLWSVSAYDLYRESFAERINIRQMKLIAESGSDNRV